MGTPGRMITGANARAYKEVCWHVLFGHSEISHLSLAVGWRVEVKHSTSIWIRKHTMPGNTFSSGRNYWRVCAKSWKLRSKVSWYTPKADAAYSQTVDKPNNNSVLDR